MCWRVGTVEDVASICALCKAYAIKGSCPHERQVCSDRTNHPNFDVRHFVNTDCRFANNCGYCKMARANPAADAKHNRGWPGCCRPPNSHEWEMMVKDLEIASMISRLHDVPIPADLRRRLEASSSPRPAPRQPAHTDRDPAPAPAPAADDRRVRSRDNSVTSAPTSAVTSPALRPQPPRRSTTEDQHPHATSKRSPTIAQQMATMSLAPAPSPRALSSLSSSGSSDSGSNRGALSDSDCSTVRSEFTDYLSEESEAELQRQALLRAELKKEEDEFKAARAKLAGITTNPPVEWLRNNSNGPGSRGPANLLPKPVGGPQGRGNPLPAARKGSPTSAVTAPPRPSASTNDIQRALAAAVRAPASGVAQRQPQQQRV